MKYGWYYLLIFIITSCSSVLSEEENRKNLEEQVLTQHDVAMSKMGELNQIQAQLNSYINRSDTLETKIALLRKQVADLKNADAAMMDWMHQYKSPENLSDHAATNYLQKQLVKIDLVTEQINRALDAAQKSKEHYESITNK